MRFYLLEEGFIFQKNSSKVHKSCIARPSSKFSLLSITWGSPVRLHGHRESWEGLQPPAGKSGISMLVGMCLEKGNSPSMNGASFLHSHCSYILKIVAYAIKQNIFPIFLSKPTTVSCPNFGGYQRKTAKKWLIMAPA